MIDVYLDMLKQAVASAAPSEQMSKFARILDDSVYVPISFNSETGFDRDELVSNALASRVLYRYVANLTPG